jgi:hypothetical protein
MARKKPRNRTPKIRLGDKFPKHINFTDHWLAPGVSSRKTFQAATIRYGIKGYLLGRNIAGVPVDLIFVEEFVAVRVGSEFSYDEVIELECMNFHPISLGSKPDIDWLKACAVVLNVNVKDLKPRNDYATFMEEVENKALFQDILPNSLVISNLLDSQR